MYAILEVGGKQYKVAPKDVIEVNKLDEEAKNTITLDKVLLLADGKKVEIGQPYVTGAKVEAEVVGQTKGKKLIVYKYLRRKDSHKKTGHRQKLTKLLIKKISNK
ncbi:MAG: 50S ribosomal protein L21 [Candidatus Omnitrophica bacterium]|nr:50S ribosomal protein L21 [Candidatus Omnitrophota bacterium]